MTIADLLSQLDSVKQRGARWGARCPAHADKSPSLSIAEGDKGLLVRCFAGCSLSEICAALDIKPKDLFFDSRIDPQARQRTQQRLAQKRHDHEVFGMSIDVCRGAEEFIGSRRGLDILGWSAQRIDEELNALADAYTILECEALDA